MEYHKIIINLYFLINYLFLNLIKNLFIVLDKHLINAIIHLTKSFHDNYLYGLKYFSLNNFLFIININYENLQNFSQIQLFSFSIYNHHLFITNFQLFKGFINCFKLKFNS